MLCIPHANLIASVTFQRQQAAKHRPFSRAGPLIKNSLSGVRDNGSSEHQVQTSTSSSTSSSHVHGKMKERCWLPGYILLDNVTSLHQLLTDGSREILRVGSQPLVCAQNTTFLCKRLKMNLFREISVLT